MLGSFYNHFGMILGSFWDHFGIILGSFWDYFGIMFGSFSDYFRIILASFCDPFKKVLETFWARFGMIWELFRDHFFGIFYWGNQVGIIGGTRLGARGTAAPAEHNTVLYQNSKNPKGKPGWGKNSVHLSESRFIASKVIFLISPKP